MAAKNSERGWKDIHADYKTTIDGRRMVMEMTDRGTALVPWVGPKAGTSAKAGA